MSLMTKGFLLLHTGQNVGYYRFICLHSHPLLIFKCTFVSDYSLESVQF